MSLADEFETLTLCYSHDTENRAKHGEELAELANEHRETILAALREYEERRKA